MRPGSSSAGRSFRSHDNTKGSNPTEIRGLHSSNPFLTPPLDRVRVRVRAGNLADLSVHMCFICVLHLANEHGLAIVGQEGMDELMIGNVQVAAR